MHFRPVDRFMFFPSQRVAASMSKHAVIWFMTMTCLAGCTPHATVSARLEHAFERAKPGELIRIQDLTDFEWDFFVVLGPYTSREAADAALGFSWPDFERFGLASEDRFSLLVFTKAGSVVHAEEHPRCKPDFEPDILGRPLPPDIAVLSIDFDRTCPTARRAT